MAQEVTFFEAVGGEETFRRLVHRFYAGVAEDPVLRPLYPEEDFGPAEERLRRLHNQNASRVDASTLARQQDVLLGAQRKREDGGCHRTER